MKNRIFEKVLNDVSLDARIVDGTFRIEENEHMDILREYLINKNIDEEMVVEFCNNVLEGKFPERQAYNANGILVTFPTPEYKANAIKRGTHFEENPKRKESNLFTGNPPAGDKATPKPTSPTPAPVAGTTSLPISQSSTDTPSDAPTSPVPQTTSAPQQMNVEPTVAEKEPPKEPTELPPVPKKSPEEIEANKTMIKKMLKSDEYMLEMVSSWLTENSPEFILKEFKHRKT